MPKAVPVIDYGLCKPEMCAAGGGACVAVEACRHEIVIQEDPLDPPLTVFLGMCVGCAKCAQACPLKAIHMNR